MMNVMIIDDDDNVRERLKSIIDWEGCAANLICEAKDSDMAMELFLLYRPKIVITDINIPVISGIDLAAQLQKEDPEVCFIVITGYNDFEMAKRAFNLRTVSLLSKPVRPAEINESIRKAIQQIEDVRQQIVSFSALQRLVENNLSQVQENFMENLLRQPPENAALVPEKLKQLRISCEGDNHVVALVSLQSTKAGEKNREAFVLMLRDLIVSGIQQHGCNIYTFIDSHMRLNCVISADIPNLDNLVEELLIRIKDHISVSECDQFGAGIGSMVTEVANLHKSYAGALTALKYQSVLDNECVTHYKNMESVDLVFHSQEPIYGYLIDRFRAGDLETIEKTIRKHITRLGLSMRDGKRLIRNFFLEYVMEVINDAMRLCLDMESPEQLSKIFADVFHSENSEQCMQDVLTLTGDLIAQIKSRRVSSTNGLIKKAREYIQENLHDEQLSLDQVSKYIGLSRIYFCKQFHQSVGVSFTNYLKTERIETAKKLLLNTDMKVYEISNAVGFSSPKYFSYVFKQTVGQTPLEFQKRNKG